MKFHYKRTGRGKPLLLIHGIGGSWKSWNTIINELAKHRDIIAIDLPGHGKTAPLPGKATMSALADAVTAFLKEKDLMGVDAVGSSMGARLVLELVRRGGVLGAVVSLDPGGFWRGWDRHFFYYSIAFSIRLIRFLKPVIPLLVSTATGRSLLLFQLSAHPSKLSYRLVLDELRSFLICRSFDPLLRNIAYGEEQKGLAAGSVMKPLVIGWGRNDRVCFAKQARRGKKLFPDAQLHWFNNSGHFPHWDAPQQTIELILNTTK